MKLLVARLMVRLRRWRPPIRLPGKYPWTRPSPSAVAYGTVLFETQNHRHVADGTGGVLSVPKRMAVRKPRRRAF